MRAQINVTKLGKDVKQNLLTLQRSHKPLVPLPVRNCYTGFSTTASQKRESFTFQGRSATDRASQGDDSTIVLTGGNPNYPGVWVRAINRLLPLELRKKKKRNKHAIHDVEFHPGKILRLILLAKTRSNIDILAYLVLHQKRWDAFLWICSSLIASLGPGERSSNPKDGFTDISWPPDISLKKLSFEPFYLPQKKAARNTEFLSLRQMSGPQILDPLQSITPSDHAALGQIWTSLGLILLESSCKDDEELKSMVSKTLLVVAHLHHAGFIPHQAHQFFPNWDPLALVQPPLLNGFSQNIIRSLSDAMYTYQQVEDDESFDMNTSNIDLGGSSRLGVEVWLEFVLWCCVHGGWATHGLYIVNAMGKVPAPWRWSSKSDHQIIRDSSNTSFLIAERTIGPEVVAALVNALTIQCEGSPREEGAVRRFDVFQNLHVTQKVLNEGRMSLGSWSFIWNSAIARLSEAPNLDTSTEPDIATRYVLPLSELSEKLKESLAAPFDSSLQQKITPSIRDYVYRQPSATIAFYHQIISAFIKAKNLGWTLRSLAHLQAYTDDNKRRSIDGFLSQLISLESDASQPHMSPKSIQESDTTIVERHNGLMKDFLQPGYFPELPVHILVGLLDLLTVSGATEVGKWMIYSKDIDGPLIDKRLYTNNAMAASLIRFATSCKDIDLIETVTSSLSAAISEDTLLALACSCIRQRRFNSAEEVLGDIQKRQFRYWNTHAFANLTGALISQSSKESVQDARSFSELSRLTSNLLQGRLGPVWLQGEKQFTSIVDVAASCGLPTDDLFATAGLIPSSNSRLKMHIDDFQLLLGGAMEAGGSIVGKRLWDKWCTVEVSWPSGARLDPESNDSKALSSGVAKLSPAAVNKSSVSPSFNASTRRRLSAESTARMIVHKAATEVDQGDMRKAQEALEVLEWGRKAFGEAFVDGITFHAMHCVGMLNETE